MQTPLEGIKIIELSRVLTGSYCTMLLGDMGAEVIKIDQPLKAGKPIWGGGRLPAGEEKRREAVYNALQRNKKSIALDLGTARGQQIFYRIARDADVVLECFRPGVVSRLKVDYETIRSINPGIVYCSLSGYGQDGPYANLPGHDINYISVAGILSMIGDVGQKPVIPLNLIGDFAGGSVQAALGITLALLARHKTGTGQYIDMSITDGSISLISFILNRYFMDGQVLSRGKTLLAGIAPMYNTYMTGDSKYISIGCLEPELWANLCSAMGKEDLIPCGWDIDRWPAMVKEFEAIFALKTRDEWFDILGSRNIAIARVYDLDEVVSDPQVSARKMVISISHEKFGEIRQPGIAIKLSETPGSIRSLGPLLGEHTGEIMQRLGYSAEEIINLRGDSIIA